MDKLANKFLFGQHSKAFSSHPTGDLFVASVINQKVVNQSSQQVLVAIAAQVLNIYEAQFGFSTNDDSDTINV